MTHAHSDMSHDPSHALRVARDPYREAVSGEPAGELDDEFDDDEDWEDFDDEFDDDDEIEDWGDDEFDDDEDEDE